ncbi:DUF2000 domain-containing protein [Roseospira visakhapatnamensis]|uniref:DUF2000 domain-containing protein n=1 Tax=Roseospira visakhapatnamensis TaxID=390880 RepID=A0A7W6WA10_9PROT|nr:DUF2000 domain-containing protein [Roseospira visakhapatnamensis]MBB4265967.1 hypothetical protein [Roseospira visakhapatnamensis]
MHDGTKIAIVVRDTLLTWQKLNVVGFVAGGLVGSYPELVGSRYVDGSGRAYGPLIRQPVLIFAAPDAATLAMTLDRALRRGLTPSIYTADLFGTGHDADNRAAVAAVPAECLDLVGLAVHGPRKDVEKTVKGLVLHD